MLHRILRSDAAQRSHLHVAAQRIVVKTINLQIFIEVVQTSDPLQRIFGIGLNAYFLRDLVSDLASHPLFQMRTE
jgi:hypothetical protein